MSKSLGRDQLFKNTNAGKSKTWGAMRNTPAALSSWLDGIIPIALQNDVSLLFGTMDGRPEVKQYHEHVASLKAAVKDGNWQAAIVAAWQAGQAQATAGLADEAKRERKARRDRSAGHKQTPIEKMRRQLRAWDKQLVGCTKIGAAMRRLRIPKSTYYKYKAAVKAAGKKT